MSRHQGAIPAFIGQAQHAQQSRDFARRLYERMVDKGMNQAALARAVWGTQTDRRGYTVPRNRDRISSYLAGRGMPDPVNLKKIADILGTQPEDLAPDTLGTPAERANPELAITAIAGHADKVMFKVSKLLPLEIVSKIVTMIAEHEQKTHG